MSESSAEVLKEFIQGILAGEEVSQRQFCVAFGWAVISLNLSDEEIAKRFSASKFTADSWIKGESAPAQTYRRQILAHLFLSL